MKEVPQSLALFLPAFREALLKQGMSAEASDFICESVRCGATPPKIRTLAQYQDAWIASHVAQDILIAVDDDSEAALWASALALTCFDFEDAYLAEHGHLPLSPAPKDMEVPSGSA